MYNIYITHTHYVHSKPSRSDAFYKINPYKDLNAIYTIIYDDAGSG